jgi:hypothetical protein
MCPSPPPVTLEFLAVAYTDLLLRLGRLSQPAVAGSVPAERAKRAAGATSCP